MAEGAEAPQPTEHPHQAPQSEQVKAVIIPPTHAEIVKPPIDSQKDPRVTGKFAELKQNPSLLEPNKTEGMIDWTKKPKPIEDQYHLPFDAQEMQDLPHIRSQEQWERAEVKQKENCKI